VVKQGGADPCCKGSAASDPSWCPNFKAGDRNRGRKQLEPEKSANFQVGFKRLPEDWNYVVPDVHVKNINFK